MVQNVGGIDKVARIIIGLAIIVTGFWVKSWWGIIGLIPLLTAVFGICPAYLPFGFKTCMAKKSAKA
jgi:hypothetical protein